MRLLDLIPMARDSVANPREGYRIAAGLQLDRQSLWIALAAITVLNVLMAEVMLYFFRRAGVDPMFGITTQPLTTALLRFGLLAVLVYLVYWGGRMLGGQGTFDDALLAIVWLLFIMGCLQAIQLVALLVFPFVAALLGLVGVALFFWLLTGFVGELHGFTSGPKIFLSLVVGMLGLGLALIVLLTLIGVGLPEVPDV